MVSEDIRTLHLWNHIIFFLSLITIHFQEAGKTFYKITTFVLNGRKKFNRRFGTVWGWIIDYRFFFSFKHIPSYHSLLLFKIVGSNAQNRAVYQCRVQSPRLCPWFWSPSVHSAVCLMTLCELLKVGILSSLIVIFCYLPESCLFLPGPLLLSF